MSTHIFFGKHDPSSLSNEQLKKEYVLSDKEIMPPRWDLEIRYYNLNHNLDKHIEMHKKGGEWNV